MPADDLILELQKLNIILPSGASSSWGLRILQQHQTLYDVVYSFTDGFIDQSFSERIYCIRNNITTQPLCKECHSPITGFNATLGYGIFCSANCSNKNEDKKLSVIETNNVRYGMHPRKLKTVQDKAKQTNLKRHGVEYPLASKEIREKGKQTCLELYGTEYHQQSIEGKHARKMTCLRKYNTETPFHSKEIQEKVKRTVMERYNVVSTMQLESTKKKHIKNARLHNVEWSTQKQYNDDVFQKLNSVEWLKKQYTTKSSREISTVLKVDKKTVVNYLKKYDIDVSVNRRHSKGEAQLLNFIKSLDIVVEPNTRNIITPLELDIYTPEYDIAFEYNGLYWHSEQAGKDKHYHANKHKRCAAIGIQLITVFEDEWYYKQGQVKAKIKSLLNKDDRDKIFARKTNIINVSKREKSVFLEKNHIQGNGRSSIDVGLLYNNDLVACMSLIYRKDSIFELTRYATSCQVPGGFSKLLKYFENQYSPTEIYSFADLRWSTGNLYGATGWEIDKIIPPDYSYSPDGITRYHKFKYRRKNLPKLLKYFDPDLSERINCDNNNVLRIWDCGKIRFKRSFG